jgi:ribosome maturation factor RimP
MKSLYQLGMEEKLRTMMNPLISESGCELVEVQLVQRKLNSLVRVLVDRLGGVSLDDCATLSRQISYMLEVEDPIDRRYTLEVSSPGLDRPLTTPADFRRKVGELVKLSFRGTAAKTVEMTGEIVKVDDLNVTLRTSTGEESCLLSDIIRGKIVF